ncbi:hypothetical protein C8J57DRAFT_766126 [Mycena rebaudengoi]|nr:hypothetical protein C8J57DRAFT_766126 [Mycena rebaudengoi]
MRLTTSTSPSFFFPYIYFSPSFISFLTHLFSGKIDMTTSAARRNEPKQYVASSFLSLFFFSFLFFPISSAFVQGVWAPGPEWAVFWGDGSARPLVRMIMVECLPSVATERRCHGQGVGFVVCAVDWIGVDDRSGKFVGGWVKGGAV